MEQILAGEGGFSPTPAGAVMKEAVAVATQSTATGTYRTSVAEAPELSRLTAREVISRFDSLCPNSLSEEQKLFWLVDLDKQLWTGLYAQYEGLQESTPIPKHKNPEGINVLLLVEEPYAWDLYISCLEAEMYHYGREDGRFNQSLERHYTAFRNYSRYLNRTQRPKGLNRKFW
ncbi:MAG: hypothetical protein IKM59_00905 [Oscillospiraceae bacterium]|nr:hypothetical protein [Oscillospiraceae bacterium]